MKVITLEQATIKLIGERGTKHSFFADNEAASGISLSVNLLKPKSAPGNYHLHTKSSSIYYVLEGAARFIVNGKEMDLVKDTAILLERNEPHSISNVSDSNTLLLEIYSPANPDFVEVKWPSSILRKT
ncbi:MAG: cupin domain-containing protein [Nitrososphaerales archaeon]